jgi:hypothetical protein
VGFLRIVGEFEDCEASLRAACGEAIRDIHHIRIALLRTSQRYRPRMTTHNLQIFKFSNQ